MNHAWLKNLILAQVLIYAGIKSILTILFINNPGSIVEFHLFDHNMQLLSFYPLGKIFLWLGIIVTGTILAFYNWSAKPDFLKHGLWLCIPLVFCTMLFGFVDELRVYYEVYPIIILLVYQSLCELAGIHLEKVAI